MQPLPTFPARLVLCACLAGLVAPSPARAQSSRDIRQARRELELAARKTDLNGFVSALQVVLEDRASRALPIATAAFGRIVDRDDPIGPELYYTFHSQVARAVGEAIDADAVDVAERLQEKERSWPGRLILLEAANFSEAWDLRKAALRALEDDHPKVVRRSLHYLQNARDLEVVDAIVERYLEAEKEKSRDGENWDRTRLAFQDALTKLLKRRLYNAEAYKGYLSTRRNDPDLFDPPPRRQGRSEVSLFGMDISGRNIVFIIDVSGSMLTTDPLPPDQRGPRGRTAVGDPSKRPEAIENRRRITRARKELASVVKALPEYVRFNIVPYSTEVELWKGGLVKATKANKEDAVGFVEKLEADGVTVTDSAIETAFSDLSVDTIYLITDGAPTHVGTRIRGARPPDSNAIIRHIHDRLEKLNFLRDVRIFTLGFPGAEEEFLKKVSRDHSGEYAPIR